jgi:hypothetical protein
MNLNFSLRTREARFARVVYSDPQQRGDRIEQILRITIYHEPLQFHRTAFGSAVQSHQLLVSVLRHRL